MSLRHVLILKGSPRGHGNSSLLADRLAEGAQAAGAEVESYSLQTMDIRPCDACDACHEYKGGGCIIDDDMQKLYPSLQNADAIVLASPVYWFSVSAQMKLCIDRWYALESPTGNSLRGKQFGLLLTYGDIDPYTSGAINAIHMFRDIFHYIRADIAGVVYGSASNPGDILKQPEILEKAYQLGHKLGTAS